jgi:DNA-binding IclR family transcriptional regulator
MAETVKSVERAADILLLLHNNDKKLGVSEIANQLDLHKSTVHRILASFEVKGLVKKTDDEKYGIGLRIFAMGLKVSKEFSILEIIKPYTRRLMKEVGEVVNISMLEENFNGKYRTIMVAKEYSAESVLLANLHEGAFSDAHISAVGKCLLAFSKKVELTKISEDTLTKYTENSITTMSGLLKEIDEVRKIGYAVDNEEREMGLFCVAVPVFEADGDVSVAISISGPTVRMKNKDLQSKIDALIRIQFEINQVLKTLK